MINKLYASFTKLTFLLDISFFIISLLGYVFTQLKILCSMHSKQYRYVPPYYTKLMKLEKKTEQKLCYRPSTSDNLTEGKSTSNFLLTVSSATDPPIFHLQILFLNYCPLYI